MYTAHFCNKKETEGDLYKYLEIITHPCMDFTCCEQPISFLAPVPSPPLKHNTDLRLLLTLK